ARGRHRPPGLPGLARIAQSSRQPTSAPYTSPWGFHTFSVEPSMDALRLFDYSAGDARAATAQRRGAVGVVVSAGMHHQGTSLEVGLLQAWRQHRLGGRAFFFDVQTGQITQMTIAPRRTVLAGAVWVVMPPGRLGGGHLAVILGRVTAGVLVQVKTMQARRQALEIGGEHQAVLSAADGDVPKYL